MIPPNCCVSFEVRACKCNFVMVGNDGSGGAELGEAQVLLYRVEPGVQFHKVPSSIKWFGFIWFEAGRRHPF